jgi:hypothetical protein
MPKTVHSLQHQLLVNAVKDSAEVSNRACEAGDSLRVTSMTQPLHLPLKSVAHFVGCVRIVTAVPRLGFAIAWGYYSFRQLRRLDHCMTIPLPAAQYLF